MFDTLLNLLQYFGSFIVVISVIVFIHEFGHYFVAKCCGVRIEAFSIGFGKEIFGWNDRSGTRWKISLLPLGGYVKMFGDASEASNADKDKLEQMTPEERAVSFHYKPLWQKAAVVAAGPMFNFILTIGIFCYFILTVGLPSTEPIIGEVLKDTPAQAAGLMPDDRVVTIDGKKIHRFNDIPMILSTNIGKPVELEIKRGEKTFPLTIIPAQMTDKDALGNEMKRPMIGIKSKDVKYVDVGFFAALGESVSRTYTICVTTLHILGQMITGERSATELQGPVGIAKLSGQAANQGMSTVIWLIAMLSANLGLVNLLPVPVLDGGHLMYYSAQALRGRPLADRIQNIGYKIGFALIAALMLFTIFNDLRRLIFSA